MILMSGGCKTSDTNPFRYCGEYYDSETGLIYLCNRYYDSTLGRFISEDPARDGTNWYVYCENNPVGFVDPLGLEAIYIFYGKKHGENGGFDSRAEAEAKSWKNKGYTVKAVPIRTEKEFVSNWNALYNNGGKIVKVSLYFHSNPTTLILDYTKDEYMATSADGKTSKGSDGTSLLSLDVKNISTICLYACNSAHQNYAYNIAATLFYNQEVNTVYGWDGSMRWSRANGKPILAKHQQYFEDWRNSAGERQRVIKYSRSTRPYVTYPGTWDRR